MIYKQAVVGSRDEERERLRQELKAAQDELNMLREIQRKVSSTSPPDIVKRDRPQSLVSETSTVSSEDGTTQQPGGEGRTLLEQIKIIVKNSYSILYFKAKKGEHLYLKNKKEKHLYLKSKKGEHLYLKNKKGEHLYLKNKKGKQLYLKSKKGDHLYLKNKKGEHLYFKTKKGEHAYACIHPFCNLEQQLCQRLHYCSLPVHTNFSNNFCSCWLII